MHKKIPYINYSKGFSFDIQSLKKIIYLNKRFLFSSIFVLASGENNHII